jgi:secreted trypsin-like serine protease
MSAKTPSRVVAAVLLLLPAAPVAAQSETNWARDVVTARVFARNLQALSHATGSGTMPNVRDLLEPRIVGGAPATQFQNPFQVALLTKSIANNAAAQFCGGTLLAPRHVVTAAHCSDFVAANQVQVLTGTRRLDGTGARVDITAIAIHPNWNAMTFNNDVAVWTLAADQTQLLAELANQDGPVGGQTLVTGWGTTSEGGTSPIALEAVQVPLVDAANCNDANSYNGDITDRMICAGLDGGGQDSCQGDSGGPLTRGLNNAVLTGIVSWGIGCARPNLYGVYTRVSAPAIRQFIEGIVPSPVLSGSGTAASVTGFGTTSNVVVTVSGSERELWGSGKYADVRATANAYCQGLGLGPVRTWEANACGEDESSYVRFSPGANRWEFRSSGSANNEPGFCRYPLLTSVACGG